MVHAYFNLTLEEISADHTPDQEFILPECGHSGYDYFSLSSRPGVACFTDETDAKTAASHFTLIRRGSTRVFLACEIQFSGDNFISWLRDTSEGIAQELGLSGQPDVMYYLFEKGNYVVFSGTTLQENQIPVTGITLNVQSVSLPGIGAQEQLTVSLSPADAHIWDVAYESSDESVAVVSSSGLVTAAGLGTAVITARDPDGKISAYCTVTVTEAPAHSHVEHLRQIAAFEAGCTTEGSTGYYICTKCCMRFADEAATQLLTDVSQFILPATGHTANRWQRANKEHYQICSCGVQIDGTRASHLDQDSDEFCDDCGAAMSPIVKSGASAQESKGTGWILPVILVVAAAVTVVIVGKKRYWF